LFVFLNTLTVIHKVLTSKSEVQLQINPDTFPFHSIAVGKKSINLHTNCTVWI